MLLAHGSPREGANDEVRRLAAAVGAECAFLGSAQPSFSSVVARLVAAGATRLVVLPLFLSAGRHVTEHVPALVDAARATHPEVRFEVLPHVGAGGAVQRFVRLRLLS